MFLTILASFKASCFSQQIAVLLVIQVRWAVLEYLRLGNFHVKSTSQTVPLFLQKVDSGRLLRKLVLREGRPCIALPTLLLFGQHSLNLFVHLVDLAHLRCALHRVLLQRLLPHDGLASFALGRSLLQLALDQSFDLLAASLSFVLVKGELFGGLGRGSFLVLFGPPLLRRLDAF